MWTYGRHVKGICVVICLAVCLLKADSRTGEGLEYYRACVQFEHKQNDGLRAEIRQVTSEFRKLPRGKSIPTSAVTGVLKVRQDFLGIVDRLGESNARQASLAEKIGMEQRGASLSSQERIEYQGIVVELQRMSTVQKNMLSEVNAELRKVQGYIDALPPPDIIKMPCGIEMELVEVEGAAFFVSAPLTAKAISLSGGDSVIHPSYHEAREIVLALVDREQLPLSIPKQEHFELMALAGKVPPLAVWSQDVFSLRRSLAQKRQRRKWEQLSIENVDFPVKKNLTSAQAEALARFHVTFMLVWDGNHLLGDKEAFTRELPGVACPEIGVIVVAPVKVGKKLRLQELETAFREGTPVKETRE